MYFYFVVVRNGKEVCEKARCLCEVVFCQSKPIGSLPFSLPSPSSLPKLHSIQGMQNADTCTHRDYEMWDAGCGMGITGLEENLGRNDGIEEL